MSSNSAPGFGRGRFLLSGAQRRRRRLPTSSSSDRADFYVASGELRLCVEFTGNQGNPVRSARRELRGYRLTPDIQTFRNSREGMPAVQDAGSLDDAVSSQGPASSRGVNPATCIAGSTRKALMPEQQTAKDAPQTSALVTVPFHGDGIVTFEANGEPHVAMRRIVENLGIDWATQLKRLEADGRFNCSHMPTVGADGKQRDMLSMPTRKLALWLATINPNKIPDLARRAKVELYQEESAVALHDYWTKGAAVRGDLDGVLTEIDPNARKVLGGIMKGIIHKELAEAVQVLLPALVARAITDQQYGVVRGLTAGDVIQLAGVTDRKGLRSIPRRVSDRLRQFHAEMGAVVNRATLGCSKAYIFDAATAKRWLDEGGKATIQHWIAERRGQGTLRLVAKPI